jgi:putative transposase
MPRTLRSNATNVPQHVIQRGNNRSACFFAAVDFQRYLIYLREFAVRWSCDVHAYVLMTNHVHLLVTPREIGSVPRLMHALGSVYVPYVNRRHGRTGTLWQGRYKSCAIDSDHYLMTCYRYIEQNPLRASMVTDLGEYPWSSYRSNALGSFDPVITPHPLYLDLGASADTRAANYRAIVRARLDDAELDQMRTRLERGQRGL